MTRIFFINEDGEATLMCPALGRDPMKMAKKDVPAGVEFWLLMETEIEALADEHGDDLSLWAADINWPADGAGE